MYLVEYKDNFDDNESTIYYLRRYIPSRFHKHDDFSKKIIEFKNNDERCESFFRDYVCNAIKSDRVLIDAVINVPSSKTKNVFSAIFKLADRVATCLQKDSIVGTLERVYDIPSSHVNGKRTIEEHLNSLAVKNLELVEGKSILLIDDVATSGNTMYSCRKKLLDAKAKKVYCLVLGLTEHWGNLWTNQLLLTQYSV